MADEIIRGAIAAEAVPESVAQGGAALPAQCQMTRLMEVGELRIAELIGMLVIAGWCGGA